MTAAPFEVFVLDDGYLIIELHERTTAPAPALELHVRRDDEEAWAYWLLCDGTFLCAASMGLA